MTGFIFFIVIHFFTGLLYFIHDYSYNMLLYKHGIQIGMNIKEAKLKFISRTIIYFILGVGLLFIDFKSNRRK